MASAKVKYVDIGPNSAEEYWDQIVVPSVQEFYAKVSPAPRLRRRLRFGTSLIGYGMTIIKEKTAAEKSANIKGGFKKACPEMGWLGDISDARKHRGLGRPDTTVKGTRPDLMPRAGMIVGGTGGFNEIVTIEMDDGSRNRISVRL